MTLAYLNPSALDSPVRRVRACSRSLELMAFRLCFCGDSYSSTVWRCMRWCSTDQRVYLGTQLLDAEKILKLLPHLSSDTHIFSTVFHLLHTILIKPRLVRDSKKLKAMCSERKNLIGEEASIDEGREMLKTMLQAIKCVTSSC